MSDDYVPLPQPSCLEKIIILAMVVISAIFFQRKGKQKR